MKIKEVVDIIEQYAPIEIAMEGDRAKIGLQLGDVNRECSGVLVALDATKDVICQAIEEGCNLVVTHHPMIYHPLQKIDETDQGVQAVAEAIKHDITVYSAHTNLDGCDVGTNATLVKLFGGEFVGRQECEFFAQIAPTTLGEFAKHVSKVLDDPSVKVSGDVNKVVSKFAVCSGSGASYEYMDLARANADVYVTGEIPHHVYLAAVANNFALVEFSHFSSEAMVVDIFSNMLADKVRVIKAKQHRPFRTLEEI